tara:strand:- start:256 stop:1356 length:1101 start_codon:yes stop_codon:yes gene_type:complete
MKLTKLLIKTKNKNYSIFVGKNISNSVSDILKKERINFNKCLIVLDKKVPRNTSFKIIKAIKCKFKKIKYFSSSEKNKNLNSVNVILNLLFKENFNRDDCIIAIGGGIAGDIVGFVSSIYKRGMKFINIPTTLLSQVDSSVGGKTGVNNKYGKNLIGSFNQPDLVLSEINFLKTLPKRELICGYAEILKHTIIADKKKFLFLEKNKKRILDLNYNIIQKAIVDSCNIKKKVIEKDEKESNLRKVLNFGHTFGHSFEATLKYSKKLNHGEAVLMGMKCAVKFSQQIKYIEKNDALRIIKHIESLKIKSIKNFFKLKHLNTLIKFIKIDKKNKSNKINLILLKRIGKPEINSNYNLNIVKSFLYNELN